MSFSPTDSDVYHFTNKKILSEEDVKFNGIIIFRNKREERLEKFHEKLEEEFMAKFLRQYDVDRIREERIIKR